MNGGFGSMILEKTNEYKNKGLIDEKLKIERIGIKDEFLDCSGDQQYLRSKANLTVTNLL